MCQDWSWWLSDVVLQALFSLKKDHLRQKHGNIKTSHCSQLLVFELSWHAFSVFRCLTSFLKKSGISRQRKTSEVGLRKPRDNFSGFRKLIQWIMIYTSKNSKRKGSSPASCPSEGSTGALLRKRRGALTISGPSVVPLQRVRAVMCMGGCCLEKWWKADSARLPFSLMSPSPLPLEQKWCALFCSALYCFGLAVFEASAHLKAQRDFRLSLLGCGWLLPGPPGQRPDTGT